MMQLVHTFRSMLSARQRSGIAAVEFALIAPVLFFLLIVMLDFSYAYNVRLKVINAVTAASQFAFQKGKAVTTATSETFLNDVRNVVTQMVRTRDAPQVTVLFNNAENGSTVSNYYCLSGSPATWSSTGSAQKSCGGSIMSGKFVTISVTSNAPTLFSVNPVFGDALAIHETSIVRVK